MIHLLEMLITATNNKAKHDLSNQKRVVLQPMNAPIQFTNLYVKSHIPINLRPKSLEITVSLWSSSNLFQIRDLPRFQPPFSLFYSGSTLGGPSVVEWWSYWSRWTCITSLTGHCCNLPYQQGGAAVEEGQLGKVEREESERVTIKVDKDSIRGKLSNPFHGLWFYLWYLTMYTV